jgi:hypothetical protein
MDYKEVLFFFFAFTTNLMIRGVSYGIKWFQLRPIAIAGNGEVPLVHSHTHANLVPIKSISHLDLYQTMRDIIQVYI